MYWDDQHRLRGRQYHDGHLVGVRTNGTEVELRIHPLNEDPYALVLRDVQGFVCNDFREGNTINAVLLIPHEVWATRSTLRDRVTEAFHGLPEEPGSLFLLVCSYGAEVLALVGTVELLPGDAE